LHAASRSFYQIISTFLKSLDVPWPSVFGAAMSRVSVVNLNLVELPVAAWCVRGITCASRPVRVLTRWRVLASQFAPLAELL
jgi:hypothetical protein